MYAKSPRIVLLGVKVYTSMISGVVRCFNGSHNRV